MGTRTAVAGGVWVSILVTIWSVVALATTSRSLDTDPLVDRLVLGVMGFAFLLVGVVVYRHARTSFAFLFWLYCAFSCMHWGGLIGLGETHLEAVLLVVYVLFASALAQSLFLHLAVSFPERPRCGWLFLLGVYLPVLLGVALLGVAVVGALSTAQVSAVVGASVLYSVLGGVVWIYKLASCGRFSFKQRSVLVTALVLGWLPHVVVNASGVALGTYSVAAFLPLIAIPLALGWAIAALRSG